MRQSVAFVVVLAVAAGVGALLVMPGRQVVDVSEQGSTTNESDVPPSVANPTHQDSRKPLAEKKTPPHVRIDPAGDHLCSLNMRLVEGAHCAYVGHRCEQFAEGRSDVCVTYAAEVICEGGLRRRRFCIDMYEYPNVAGARPAVWASFDEAKRACAIEGKRLCAAEEWELACEGTAMWPFPYGRSIEADACNTNSAATVAQPNDPNLENPWTRSAEIARTDGRQLSGDKPMCVSPFGVFDLTGNVEEWVSFANGTDHQKPFNTARKGGSWLHGKGRCRPIDSSEPTWYRAEDLGFRCCADPR